MQEARSMLATVEACFENQEDLWALERGLIAADSVRRLHLPRVIVDPNAVFGSLPTSLYQRLGLRSAFPIRLTILGRSCTMDTKEVADHLPATIGHLVLTCLDLVIDPECLTLIGNPAHGGIHTIERYDLSSPLTSPTA